MVWVSGPVCGRKDSPSSRFCFCALLKLCQPRSFRILSHLDDFRRVPPTSCSLLDRSFLYAMTLYGGKLVCWLSEFRAINASTWLLITSGFQPPRVLLYCTCTGTWCIYNMSCIMQRHTLEHECEEVASMESVIIDVGTYRYLVAFLWWNSRGCCWSVKMSSRGKEVLKGKLMYRRKGSSLKVSI